MVNGSEKSDSATVSKNPTNEAGRPGSESEERRAETEGNVGGDAVRRTPSRASASRGLDRVRTTARERKKEKFTALLHHISVEALEEAFFEIRKDAAPGVDGMTWEDYEKDRGLKARGPSRSDPSGSLSRAAEPAGLYRQGGRLAAAAGGRGAGGQDCPAGDDDRAQCGLRGRLPRLQLRVPARARRA